MKQQNPGNWVFDYRQYSENWLGVARSIIDIGDLDQIPSRMVRIRGVTPRWKKQDRAKNG